ncbi:hypothetical protein PGT21_028127 [Puccinia graminis f. sp. tritici]|uniref:Uncharacterized protein n=1 Tax=Puccinia graminis f. sp. tritici TaxID=56615 RepID=A0A5B0QXA9_PUCGR|nr:hypothetical protein PGT21_028127 [Puccinia graminis f. sp. tritici]
MNTARIAHRHRKLKKKKEAKTAPPGLSTGIERDPLSTCEVLSSNGTLAFDLVPLKRIKTVLIEKLSIPQSPKLDPEETFCAVGHKRM